MAASFDELDPMLPLAIVASDLFEACAIATPYACGFFALFMSFYAVCPARFGKDSAKRAYWASSCCSFVHSLIIVPLAHAALKAGGFWSSNDLTFTTDASRQSISIFVGYILSDTLPLLYYRKQWSGTTIYIWHHLTALLCWGVMGVRGHGHAVAVGLLICEATAPFVNGRWFLAELGMKDGLLYKVNGALMCLSFFSLRIVMMGYLLFRNIFILHEGFFALPASTITIVIGGIGIGYPMQWLWFSKIFKGILKLLSADDKKQPKKKDAAAANSPDSAKKSPRRAEAFPVGAEDGATSKKRM